MRFSKAAGALPAGLAAVVAVGCDSSPSGTSGTSGSARPKARAWARSPSTAT
jgi:hypothetical protein